jgi:hypothetical protein
MTHVLHLKKNGSGMSSRTACGRNILRTPCSLPWEGFKAESGNQCAKCAASKFAAFMTKHDAKAAPAGEFGDWIPESPDAWKAADDALIAAHRARVARLA